MKPARKFTASEPTKAKHAAILSLVTSVMVHLDAQRDGLTATELQMLMALRAYDEAK